MIYMEQESSLPVTETFLITITTGVLGALSGLCVCMLKSRCTKIKCCGFEVDRDVIPARDLSVEATDPDPSQNLDGV